jgi:hypothetical protein
MDSLVAGVVVVGVVGALHFALTYAEGRGWIYYRKKHGSYGGLGTASTFLNMYDPSRKHLQEAVRVGEWQRDDEDEGDDPRRS